MDNNTYLLGSICLSDIPKELIKKVQCKDGQVRSYLNVAIMPSKNPKTWTNNGTTRTMTHYMTCAPRKEDRKDGVNYFIADFETRRFNSQQGQQPIQPTQPTQPQPSNDPFANNIDKELGF